MKYMRSTATAKGTSGKRTQVAKRKQENFMRAFVKLALALLEKSRAADYQPGGGVLLSLGDFMTWQQIRIMEGMAKESGVSLTDFPSHVLKAGMKWKPGGKAESAA